MTWPTTPPSSSATNESSGSYRFARACKLGCEPRDVVPSHRTRRGGPRGSTASRPRVASRITRRAASGGSAARRARKRARLEQVAAGAVLETELGEDRSRFRRRARLRACATPRRATARSSRYRGAVAEDAADDELRRDRPVPVVLLEAERDVVERRRGGARSRREPCPNAIALPASRPSRRTRKRRCLPSPTVASSASPQPGASSVGRRVAEPERREPRELGAEVEREVGSACDDGVDRRHGLEVVLVEHRCGLLRQRPRRTRRRSPPRSTGPLLRGGRPSARAGRSTRRARRAGRRRGSSVRIPSSRRRCPR